MHYFKHGMQTGWLIDPDERKVVVYQLRKEVAIFDEMDRRLLMPIFADGFELTVGELFGWSIE
jgi:Uma2 family endonuclease